MKKEDVIRATAAMVSGVIGEVAGATVSCKILNSDEDQQEVDIKDEEEPVQTEEVQPLIVHSSSHHTGHSGIPDAEKIEVEPVASQDIETEVEYVVHSGIQPVVSQEGYQEVVQDVDVVNSPIDTTQDLSYNEDDMVCMYDSPDLMIGME